MAALDIAELKRQVKGFGADLVGIASAETLNAYPPDPRWPQTPARLSGDLKSAVAIAVRMPLGEFRAANKSCIRHVNQLVLRRMEKVAFKTVELLEDQGEYAFQLAAEETNWELKHGSYGYLSTRHVGIEAGLGTLGLEVNLLTREFGPRIYLTAVLTTAELEPDQRITEQLCIGETCGRCLLACPADAVRHWGLDKRLCATEAQTLGIARIYRYLQEAVPSERQHVLEMLRSGTTFEIWQSVLRVVGAFGNCPRCIEVCPIGEDYVRYLSVQQRDIPEKTPEKVVRLRELRAIRVNGQPAPGLSDWNVRWIGEEGYKPRKEPRVPLSELLPLTTADVVAKAKELGADLAGVASGEALNAHPPDPAIPQLPLQVSAQDSKAVIVLAKRLPFGASRINRQSQQKLYSAELVLSALQEICLSLVYFLEDRGYPSLTIPSNHTDYDPGQGWYGPLSLSHAAVEAGLGSLGLNLMLLTPEFGPRVLLAAVLTSAPLQPSPTLARQLCLGPECGRCQTACPGSAIKHWQLEKTACAPWAAPFGFGKVSSHLQALVSAPSTEERLDIANGRDTFEIWQSMLHSVGAYTGCTRCLEVCPVGEDYARHLAATQAEIPEATPEKAAELEGMRAAERSGDRGQAYPHSARWISGLAGAYDLAE